MTEIARQCREDGVRMTFVYLPPVSRVQLKLFEKEIRRGVSVLEMSREQLEVSDRIANGLLEILTDEDIAVVDLRPALRAAEMRCYWRTDMHLNVDGHRIVAEELFEALGSR
jgi:hypothetical protein